MTRYALFLAAAALLLPTPSIASTTVETAGTCLTDSTSGRDRKDLVTWIYLAMSEHPEISALSAASAEAVEQSNERTAALLTRLIVEDCPDQMRAMVAEHGASSISLAFEVLGRVAMQELMAHPDVNAAFGGLDRYADQARINQALQGE